MRYRIKEFVYGLKPLFDFWFASVLVLLYIFLQYVIGLQGENLESKTWFYGFLILILLFLSTITEKFKPNLLFKFILFLPFFSFLLSHSELTYATFIFLVASVICVGFEYGDRTLSNFWKSVGKVLYYFVLFNIGSKLVFWSRFDDFIWIKVKETSNYYKYAQIIELVTPVLVLIIFFSSLLLFVISVKKDFIWKPLIRHWWIIPGILFFFESFSTAGFFAKEGGGAFAHWQDFTGPLEMMQQGGYLLWDVPQQYGFLRYIFIYLIPLQDVWQKTYFLNGIMQLAYSLLLFKVIWQNKGLIWYVISIGLTLGLVFYLSGHPPKMINSNAVPTGGAIRYFWIVFMLYIIVSMREKDLKVQVFIILPIWIIGFLWSVESAVYVTAILGPYVLYHILHGNNRLKERIKIMLFFPIGLLTAVLLISLIYFWRLGNLPDYWAFVEYVLYAQSGATVYFSDPINPNGPIWIPIIMISWMLNQSYEYKDKYFLFCVMSVIATIWVVFPYWVAHSQDTVVFKLMVPIFFGLFLLFSLLDEKSRMRHTYKFSPIFIMILVMSFGTPQTARHIYDTITNQDYTLENTIDEELDDMHHIFTMITPGDTPVSYIDPGRYLFYNRSNQYKDLNTGKMVTLNKKIWLPLHPADLFWDKMPLERKVEYINRWLIRHPVNEGWVVNANEQSYWWKHAHSIYEIALKQALSDKFKIKKRVEYGDLKAVLYERES